MSLDLKDLLSHPGSPYHRRFLRFAFEGVSYQVDLFASEDNYHCPIFFTKSTDALAHEWPSLPLFAFPPIAVLRRVREQWHKLILIAPIWRNQPWSSYSSCSKPPVADPLESGHPLSSERYASMAWVKGPACVATQREPFGLPEHVLNMMAEARTPSTWRLYALKWSVFLTCVKAAT